MLMVQVTYLMHKPMLPFLARLDAPLAELANPQPNVFSRFAADAARDPSFASGIRVTVLACSELASSNREATCPYVQYEFPGFPVAVDTATKRGIQPTFKEDRTFEFAPNPQTSREFVSALRVSQLTFVVFDAAGEGDEAHIGICNVSLECGPHRPFTITVMICFLAAQPAWHVCGV
jgi:C2 domain